ncbi:unnamed protein product [Adineta steineri]|uniref:DUF7033 domain-containing protein n=1 Tax=Adineta steineri TaxID=433720 RepID=A0A819SX26_9BILA|nr:unnamed protein product [Adineta steineri]CAF4068987.1 unnamed protein product [Adineta steineri]
MKEVITRSSIKRIWMKVERFAVPKFKNGYTVSYSIAEEFKKRYTVDYVVIRNVPNKKAFHQSSINTKNILYQGAVNEARGLEQLVVAMKEIDSTLYIYGNGNLYNKIKRLIKRNQLEQKILLRGMILPETLDEITSQFYIGINLVEANGLNQTYSLANKFFDYIQAGVPQFGIAYQTTTNKKEFLERKEEVRIIYDEEKFCEAVFIRSHTLLFEDDIKEIDLQEEKINNQFVLFKSEMRDAIGFDVFAAVFYLLSRYEEYYDLPKDKFDNYEYKNSVLHNHKTLDIPVVEQWLELFKKYLSKQNSLLQFKQHKASYILSFDIDVAYAYQNRSLKRVVGGFIKKLFKLQFKEFAGQLLTVLHFKKDMYDTFDYIQSTIKNKQAIFFFNMGKFSAFDKNPSYKNKKFRNQIQLIYKKNIVGLHPSYQCNSNKKLIATEKKRLEEIIKEPIKISRQHYLKLKFPETYQSLIQNKINKDFTIGYHDTFGFRAGTCKPFLFFNLEKNAITNLRLYPFAIMEGTLNDVLKLSINEAKKIILDLILITEKYQGIFIPLWHNSTLSDAEHWKGWHTVFENMLDVIDERNIENYLETKWKNIYTSFL